jgi:hypothetical protein
LELLNFRFSTKIKTLLLVLGWATSTSALTLGTIFLGYLLPKNISSGGGNYSQVINASPVPLIVFYLGSFAVCVLAAMVISDMSTTIVSFFFSYAGAAIITCIVLALPDSLGGCCGGVLEATAVTFTFGAFFPYLFFVNLAGIIVGTALAEHFS